jgi:hypothetical protein
VSSRTPWPSGASSKPHPHNATATAAPQPVILTTDEGDEVRCQGSMPLAIMRVALGIRDEVVEPNPYLSALLLKGLSVKHGSGKGRSSRREAMRARGWANELQAAVAASEEGAEADDKRGG